MDNTNPVEINPSEQQEDFPDLGWDLDMDNFLTNPTKRNPPSLQIQDFLEIGFNFVGSNQFDLDPANSDQNLTQSEKLDPPHSNATNHEPKQKGKSISKRPLTATPEIFTPIILESMPAIAEDQPVQSEHESSNQTHKNQLNVVSEEVIRTSECITLYADQPPQDDLVDSLCNEYFQPESPYQNSFPPTTAQVEGVGGSSTQVNQSPDTLICENQFTNYETMSRPSSRIGQVDELQLAANNVTKQQYPNKRAKPPLPPRPPRPQLQGNHQQFDAQVLTAPNALDQPCLISMSQDLSVLNWPPKSSHHQFNQASMMPVPPISTRPQISLDHQFNQVSMMPGPPISTRPQISFDHQCNQVSMMPGPPISTRPHKSFDHQFNQVSMMPVPPNSTSRGASRHATGAMVGQYPSQYAFELNSILNSQKGTAGSATGPTVPHQLEALSNNSHRGVQGKQQRACGIKHLGDSSSLGHSRKEASLQEWIPRAENFQGVNQTGHSPGNGDQNLNVINPQNSMGSMKNGLYDPMYAEYGLPVDPHLRLFMEKQWPGNIVGKKI